MENLLSIRSKITIKDDKFWSKNFELCQTDSYHETTNKYGYVDMATEINHTCHFATDLKVKQLWQDLNWDLLQLGANNSSKLQENMAQLMNIFFETDISPSNLILINGVDSCIDLMAHCLAEAGEAFLVPTPMCGRSYTSLIQRALVEIVPITLVNKTGTTSLTLEKIICAYTTAIKMKKNVRAVFLSNPNSMGDIYTKELLRDILTFCKIHSLHFIVDETEAFSIHSEGIQFNSVLKFVDVPDPDRTHVICGLNKDFGIPGLGVGVIHTKCKELQQHLTMLSGFENIPSPFMGLFANLIEDDTWIKEYVLNNKQRLACLHRFCMDFFETNSVRVRACPAGYTLWLDLSQVCGENFDDEREFFKYLLNEHKLYIAPGEHCLCPVPGWFRIAISQRLTILRTGLQRFTEALKNYKSGNPRKKFKIATD